MGLIKFLELKRIQTPQRAIELNLTTKQPSYATKACEQESPFSWQAF